MGNRAVTAIVFCCVFGFTVEAEDYSKTATPLKVLDTRVFKNPSASAVGGKKYCDAEGTLYFLSLSDAQHNNVHLNRISHGEKSVRTIQLVEKLASGGNQWWSLSRAFSVSPRGEILALAWRLESEKRPTLHFVRADGDGAVKAVQALDEYFSPTVFAEFPTGELLVSGRQDQKHDGKRTEKALLGIFDRAGRLIASVELDEDKAFGKDSEEWLAGAREISSMPSKVLDLSSLAMGSDGNAYLLRYANPVKVHVINAAGQLLKTLEIETDDPGYVPSDIFYHDGKLAIQLRPPNPDLPRLIRVVAAGTGDLIATYDARGLGTALSCFGSHDQFTFMSAKKNEVTLQLAVPQ